MLAIEPVGKFLADLIAVVVYQELAKLNFKLPAAERRHVLCIGVGRDCTHTACSRVAGYYACLDQLCHWDIRIMASHKLWQQVSTNCVQVSRNWKLELETCEKP
jgi:hypothetical protein